jgi:hypothetical protein
MARRKRVLLWAGLLVVLVVATISVTPWLIFNLAQPDPSPERFQLLRRGMTRDRVLAIIGSRPTRGWRTGSGYVYAWRANERSINVRFGWTSDLVVDAVMEESTIQTEQWPFGVKSTELPDD